LLRAIDGYTGREVIGLALKLALLFFVRPGELRKARWRQFDLPAAQWRIPAECMKARVQHLVPLSRQALELLLKLRTISGDSEYVFPSLRDPSRPLHGAALSGALRSLGFDRREVTPHGFRARQYARIVDSWVEQLGLDRADYGTHTLRRTKATLIYRRTKNLRAVQLLLGGTPSWKARSAILGSRSTTLSKWRSRRRFSATGRSANGTLTGQKRKSDKFNSLSERRRSTRTVVRITAYYR
jgi:integrase